MGYFKDLLLEEMESCLDSEDNCDEEREVLSNELYMLFDFPLFDQEIKVIEGVVKDLEEIINEDGIVYHKVILEDSDKKLHIGYSFDWINEDDIEVGKTGYIKLHVDDRYNIKDTKEGYFLFVLKDYYDYTQEMFADSNQNIEGEPVGIFFDSKYKLANPYPYRFYEDGYYYYPFPYYLKDSFNRNIPGRVIKAEEGMSPNFVYYQIITMVDDENNTYEGYYYPIEKALEVGQTGYMTINSDKFKEKDYRGLFIADKKY